MTTTTHVRRPAVESEAARALRLLEAVHPTWTPQLREDLVRIPHLCAPTPRAWAFITGLDVWTADAIWPTRRAA